MKKKIFLLLRIFITVGLLYYVYAKIDKNTLLNILKHGQILWLLIALAVFIISNVSGSFQWYLLLKIHRLKIKYRYIFKLYLSSAFFNNFMPSNIGGDVVKVYKFVKTKKNIEIALASIIWDRAVSFYILLLFTSFSSIFILHTFLIFFAFIILTVIIIILLKIFIKKQLANKFLNKLNRKKLKLFLQRFLETFKFYFKFNPNSFVYYSIALFTQFIKIFINFFIIKYLGLNIRFAEIYFIIPIIGMISILPISINGIGLRESLGRYFFGLLNKSFIKTSILFSIGNIIITVGNSFGAVFLIGKTDKNK